MPATKLKFIVEEVKEVPKSKKASRVPQYDELINSIVKNPKNVQCVKVEGGELKKLYAPLHTRVKTFNDNTARTFNLKMSMRSDAFYFEKEPLKKS